MWIRYSLDWLLSFIATTLRMGAGGTGRPHSIANLPLTLYEFEGCPFCRIAREQVSASGVTVHVKPCPKGGKRFRPEVKDKGGKAQFPYLIDPNASDGEGATEMYESGDIAAYVRREYGSGRPMIHGLGPLNLISSQFATLSRYASGILKTPAKSNEKPLRFFGAERSPSARLVKETLCSMELDYLWTSQALDGQTLPRLEDENSDTAVTGGRAILNYLRKSYRSEE